MLTKAGQKKGARNGDNRHGRSQQSTRSAASPPSRAGAAVSPSVTTSNDGVHIQFLGHLARKDTGMPKSEQVRKQDAEHSWEGGIMPEVLGGVRRNFLKGWASPEPQAARQQQKSMRKLFAAANVVKAHTNLRGHVKAHTDFRGLHKLEQKHKAAVTCCSFSHDGSAVCTTSWDCAAHLYDARTGEHLQALTGVHTEGGTLCCSFGFDATKQIEYLCVGGVDKSISLYRRQGSTWKRCHPHVVKLTDVHKEGVVCCSFGWRKDDTWVNPCDPDRLDLGLQLCLGSWDRTASLISRVTEMFDAAMKAGDNKPLQHAAGEFDNIMRIHEHKFEEGFRQKHFKIHTDAILCCEFSKDGSMLCLGSQDKSASVWSVRGCYKPKSPDELDDALLHSLQDLGGVKINCCSFSHDGRTLCLGSDRNARTAPSPSPYYVPGLPHVILIELRQALISYQGYHVVAHSRRPCL